VRSCARAACAGVRLCLLHGAITAGLSVYGFCCGTIGGTGGGLRGCPEPWGETQDACEKGHGDGGFEGLDEGVERGPAHGGRRGVQAEERRPIVRAHRLPHLHRVPNRRLLRRLQQHDTSVGKDRLMQSTMQTWQATGPATRHEPWRQGHQLSQMRSEKSGSSQARIAPA